MSINKGYSHTHPLTPCPQLFSLSGCYAHTTQSARQKLASAHPAGDLLTSGPRAGGQCFTSESSLLSSELQGSFPSCYPNQSLSLQGTPWVEHPRSGCPDSSHGGGGGNSHGEDPHVIPRVWMTMMVVVMVAMMKGKEEMGKNNIKIPQRIHGHGLV